MKSTLIRSLFVLVLLGGCAGSSPVQKFAESKSAFGKNPSLTRRDVAVAQLYRVYEQGATGFVPMASVRETAEQRARDFCGRTGKGYSVVGEQMSHPPYILGNFPRIEIVFACVDKYTSSQSSGVEDEKYTKLTHLKKLLDDGTVTKEEFEEQKSKILKE
jgi:hypothetical protein